MRIMTATETVEHEIDMVRMKLGKAEEVVIETVETVVVQQSSSYVIYEEIGVPEMRRWNPQR